MSKKKIYMILGIILALGCVGGIVYYGTTQTKESKTETTVKKQTREVKEVKEVEPPKVESVLPEKKSEDYEKDILTILETAAPVESTKVDELIKLTQEGDYSYESTVKIMGKPQFILDTYDGKDFYVYDESLIDKKLETLLKDENYTEDSFVKIGWITADNKIVSTYVPLDLKNEMQITGFLVEDKDSNNIYESKNLQTTSVSISDIESIDISMDSLKEKLGADLYLYKTQYPMSYESKFIQSRMDKDSAGLTSKNYTIKVEKDGKVTGYLMVETFEDVITDIYEVYEDNSQLPVVDDATADKIKNSTDMTKENFLELVPNALKVEIMRSSFDNTVSAIEYYGFIKESDKTTSKVTTIQIVNDMVVSEVLEETETTEKKENETNKEESTEKESTQKETEKTTETTKK